MTDDNRGLPCRRADGTVIEPGARSGHLRAYSVAALTEVVSAPSSWGPWRLDLNPPAGLVLTPAHPGYDYWVSLEDCTTSARVLDWIAQVAGKTWADQSCTAGLFTALNDVLRLQANLCGCGRSRRLTRTRIAALAAEADQRRRQAYQVYPELAETDGWLPAEEMR